METHSVPDFTMVNAAAAVLIALVYIAISSLIKEPHRQKYNAIIIAGAGAAYLSGGLGLWEFAFCAIMSLIAFKGLDNYYFIGLGWLLHSSWDVMHHLYGNPIVAFSPSSSAGCAICDAVLAIWFFFKAPNIFSMSYKVPQPNIQ